MSAESIAWSYGCLLKQCVDLEQGKRLHVQLSRTGCDQSRFVSNLLVEMYSRCGSLDDAVSVFKCIANKNVFSWNIVIAAYARYGHFVEAVFCFREMQCEGVRPDKVTFSTVLGPCSSLEMLADCRQIQTRLEQEGCSFSASDGVVLAALVHSYGKFGRLAEARSVLCKDREQNSDVWNALMAAYVQNGYSRLCLELLSEMHLMGVKPDAYTFSTSATACSALGDHLQGRRLYEQVCFCGLLSNQVVGVSLVEMFGKHGYVEQAWSVFSTSVSVSQSVILWNSMLAVFAQNGRVAQALEHFELMHVKSDTISWTTLIAAFAQRGDSDQSLKMFSRMDSEGIKPDRVTFIGVLEACACSGDLGLGRRIHKRIRDSGFESFKEVGNALLNMYAKCGGLRDVKSLFLRLVYKKDVISWSTMVEAFAEHGHGDEALEFFRCMQQEGIRPNSVTFLSILSACRHAGLLDEALSYFSCMVEDYSLEASKEHSACVVDLLGRAGHLREAKEVLLGTKGEEVAWTSFLVGCNVHGEVQEAGLVADKLSGCDRAGVHVLMSNILASRD